MSNLKPMGGALYNFQKTIFAKMFTTAHQVLRTVDEDVVILSNFFALLVQWNNLHLETRSNELNSFSGKHQSSDVTPRARPSSPSTGLHRMLAGLYSALTFVRGKLRVKLMLQEKPGSSGSDKCS